MVASKGPIKWDDTTKKEYEAGLDRGVLYITDPNDGKYKAGEGWNGLTKVSESPEGGDVNTKYANNNTYLNLQAPEKFKGSISAYTYPPSFAKCDGSSGVIDSNDQTEVKGLVVTGQTRVPFGLTYRTFVGNDTQGLSHGYKIHLVYNATAAVSPRDNETINDSPDAMELKWDFNTTPVPVPTLKPSAHLIINSRTTDPNALEVLEKVLYGTENTMPTLPTPDQLVEILKIKQKDESDAKVKEYAVATA